MRKDPIVEEVRKYRARIWDECGGDMNQLLLRLKKAQEQHHHRLFTREDLHRFRSEERQHSP